MKGRVLNASFWGSMAVVAVVVWMLLASVPKTSAIPAFSRKYQTSCTTCHNNYPELNDFGEAFKKNGFKFPKDDEVFVKEPPVLLGSKAQKEAFPGVVYPGEIPGYLPKNSLNVRFGQFEPDLPFSQARTYYLSGYDVFGEAATAQGPACGGAVTVCQTTHNAFILGSPQRGIEFGGTPNNGNFNWSVAVLDGTGSNYGLGGALTARNTKDGYLRTSYKFNLERHPESRNAGQAAGPTSPRDHTSIRV